MHAASCANVSPHNPAPEDKSKHVGAALSTKLKLLYNLDEVSPHMLFVLCALRACTERPDAIVGGWLVGSYKGAKRTVALVLAFRGGGNQSIMELRPCCIAVATMATTYSTVVSSARSLEVSLLR